MGRKKKGPETTTNEENLKSCCMNCGNVQASENGEHLICPVDEDGPEPVGKMDWCGQWIPQNAQTDQQEASALEKAELTLDDSRFCKNCEQATDSPDSTPEDPLVHCKRVEMDVPADEPACPDFEPESSNTCGNCFFGDKGEEGIEKPSCALEVVEPDVFDASCPGCDKWKPEDWDDGEKSERSITGYGIQGEMPSGKPTADFNLYAIKDFEHELNVALFEVYKYLATSGNGEPTIAIKLSGFQERIKASIVVTLPNTIKYSAGSVEIVRENGMFRMVLPDQPTLFEQPAIVQEVLDTTEPEPAQEETPESAEPVPAFDGETPAETTDPETRAEESEQEAPLATEGM